MQLKQKVKCTIASMDYYTLQSQCLPLLCSSAELWRQAVAYIVEHMNMDELTQWDQALDEGQEATSVRPIGSTKEAACRLMRHAATAAVSDFGEPPEADTEIECAPPEDAFAEYSEDIFHHCFLAPVAAYSAASATHWPDEEDIRDVLPAEALSDDPTFNCFPRWDTLLAEKVSPGHWLAVQQELRTKDFVLNQLERQLGFEQGRDEWLMSEWHWREKRERHIINLTLQESSCEMVFEHVGQAVNMFMGEDQHVEDTYCKQGNNYWMSEAQSTHVLFNDIQQKSVQDSAGLTDYDREEYDAHMQPVLLDLLTNFNTRRSDAQRQQLSIVQQMQKHHKKVRKRLLASAIASLGDNNGSISSSDAPQEIMNENSIVFDEVAYPHPHEDDRTQQDELEGWSVEESSGDVTTRAPSVDEVLSECGLLERSHTASEGDSSAS